MAKRAKANIETRTSVTETWEHTLTLCDPDSGMTVSVSGTKGDADVTISLEQDRDGEGDDLRMGFCLPAADFLALADRVRASVRKP